MAPHTNVSTAAATEPSGAMAATRCAKSPNSAHSVEKYSSQKW